MGLELRTHAVYQNEIFLAGLNLSKTRCAQVGAETNQEKGRQKLKTAGGQSDGRPSRCRARMCARSV